MLMKRFPLDQPSVGTKEFEEEVSLRIYGILSKREDKTKFFDKRVRDLDAKNFKYVKSWKLRCLRDEIENYLCSGHQYDETTTDIATDVLHRIEATLENQRQWAAGQKRK